MCWFRLELWLNFLSALGKQLLAIRSKANTEITRMIMLREATGSSPRAPVGECDCGILGEVDEGLNNVVNMGDKDEEKQEDSEAGEEGGNPGDPGYSGPPPQPQEGWCQIYISRLWSSTGTHLPGRGGTMLDKKSGSRPFYSEESFVTSSGLMLTAWLANRRENHAVVRRLL